VTGPRVHLADWHRRLPGLGVAGSLYAVAPSHRLEAAALLHRAGCRVHVDVIVGSEGHVGVTFAELAAVRAALPSAVVDLHLIVLGPPDPDVEREALEKAVTLGLATVTLTGGQVRRHADRVRRLRADGVGVWEQVAPGADELEAPGLVDGALVMLITPGTREAADLDRLGVVERLGSRLPVGVDGGVTGAVAQRCREAGAAYVVSGRALLRAVPDGEQGGTT